MSLPNAPKTSLAYPLDFRQFTWKDAEHWSEPEGDERFMDKVGVIDDLSVSLSRYDHALRGANDKPIISRATISARARFALNPLPRDVVDYAINENPNPFGPHFYIEVFHDYYYFLQ